MQNEQLINELKKYNNIKENLIKIIELLDVNYKKIYSIKNKMENACNFILFNEKISKNIINDIEMLNNILFSIDEKVKNITAQMN